MFDWWDKTIEPWWGSYVLNTWPHWEVHYLPNNDGPKVDASAYPTVLTDVRDGHERRALVKVLRALFTAEGVISDEYDASKDEVRDALTIAGFMWPEAFAEATRSEDEGA